MARTRNDSRGVAQTIDVTTRDAAERRSIQAQSEHLDDEPFAQVPSRRGWCPWLVIGAIRQAYGHAVAGRASAASSAGASPIGTNRAAYDVVRRILHRHRLQQCPATLRICCCRGIAVVVVLVTAISWTALGGGMVPAAADPPIGDTTAAPTPGPAPAPPGPRAAEGPGLPPGAGTTDGSPTGPPRRGPFIFIPPRTTPIPWPVRTPIPWPVRTPIPWPVRTPIPWPVATPVPSSVATPVPSSVAAPVPSSVATPVPSSVAAPVPSSVATPVPSSVATPIPPSVTTNAPTGGGGALALLIAIVFALLLAAGLFTRAHRHRRVSWMKAHVTVAPRPGPDATFETHPGDKPNRDYVLCVVPVETQRSTTVEENPL
jgi:hypothetical protein